MNPHMLKILKLLALFTLRSFQAVRPSKNCLIRTKPPPLSNTSQLKQLIAASIMRTPLPFLCNPEKRSHKRPRTTPSKSVCSLEHWVSGWESRDYFLRQKPNMQLPDSRSDSGIRNRTKSIHLWHTTGSECPDPFRLTQNYVV